MSGLYRAAYFTGAFFGPFIGGLMLEHVKYLDAYIALGCVLAANLTILAVAEMISPQTIEVLSDKQGSYKTLGSENSD
jgi:MFS family permease